MQEAAYITEAGYAAATYLVTNTSKFYTSLFLCIYLIIFPFPLLSATLSSASLLTSLGAGAAVAMAEFNIRLSPPVATPTHASPPPATAANCDPHKCPWWPYTSSKDFKANTALILVVLFCALICALAFNAAIRYVISLHCRRRRRRGDTEDQKPDPGGAVAEQAPEVPSLIYSEEMKLTECIICLSEFANGEKIRILEKCNHAFHLHCIEKWLASHSSCPTCRTDCSNDSTPVPP